MSGMMTNDPLSVLKTLEASRIKPETRMQCKVCGFVYDPAEGCAEWQVPPGTPFAEIPDNYDCPACGCPHHSFIVLDDDGTVAPPQAGRALEHRFGNVEVIVFLADARHGESSL